MTYLIIRIFGFFLDLPKLKIEWSQRDILDLGRLARPRLLSICGSIQPLRYWLPMPWTVPSNSSSSSVSPPLNLSVHLRV